MLLHNIVILKKKKKKKKKKQPPEPFNKSTNTPPETNKIVICYSVGCGEFEEGVWRGLW